MTIEEAMERVRRDFSAVSDVVTTDAVALRLIIDQVERLKDAATDTGYDEMFECAKAWEAKAVAAEARAKRLADELADEKAVLGYVSSGWMERDAREMVGNRRAALGGTETHASPMCWRVKEIECHEDGTIKRVVMHSPQSEVTYSAGYWSTPSPSNQEVTHE